MAQMDHPMLVKLHNTYQDVDRLYFLLEPVLGGEMFPLLRKHKTFPPPQAKFYAACVVLAFEYMHKRDFIYRDLKPENLLLDNDGYLKITDFGFTKKVPHKTWTMCGTPEYMAPEIISHNGHGRAVDWWCIGIFIFEMLASYTPFYGKGGNMKMYERVVRGTFNVPSHISQEAKALIRGLLRTRPHMRLGMLKVGADSIKCHPWFQSFDWQALLWRKMKAPYIPKVEGVCDVTNYKQDIKHMTVKPYIEDGTNWDVDF
jgi:protein kinase A